VINTDYLYALEQILKIEPLRRIFIMSLIGSEVKPFSASAFHNGEFVDLTDANLRGKWSVVCFYPADFTFVCPTELEDLQNQYATLKALDVEVYSVSTDTHFS